MLKSVWNIDALTKSQISNQSQFKELEINKKICHSLCNHLELLSFSHLDRYFYPFILPVYIKLKMIQKFVNATILISKKVLYVENEPKKSNKIQDTG